MIIEDIQLTDNKDVRLTAFIQRISEDKRERITSFSQETEGLPDKQPAVIIIPGGGYSRLSERESDPVALKFAGMGYQAFILKYTVSETDKEHIGPILLKNMTEPLKSYIVRRMNGVWIRIESLSAVSRLALIWQLALRQWQITGRQP